MEGTRVDRWLWATRLYKTRSDAAAACRGGHVAVNGTKAKPATPVRIGDRIQARVHRRDRVVVVSRLIDTRVGAALAAACYVDHSPPPPADPLPVAARPRGAGRPSKRERRRIDRLRGRRR